MKYENVENFHWSRCFLRIHLIGQLLDQSNLTCFYAQHCSLSNGENRRSLALSILELFKKYPPAFFFGMSSSSKTERWILIFVDLTREKKRIFLDLNPQKTPKKIRKSQKIPANPKKSQQKSQKIRKCKIENSFQQYSPIIFSSASNINKQCWVIIAYHMGYP